MKKKTLKTTKKYLLLAAVAVFSVLGFGAAIYNYSAPPVYAQPAIPECTDTTCKPEWLPEQKDPAKECGIDCGGIIDKYVNPFIKLLTALIGIVVAISLVFAGIQYSTAGGDASKVAAAKKRIMNALIALLAYLFTFTFLQWLIPGGVV